MPIFRVTPSLLSTLTDVAPCQKLQHRNKYQPNYFKIETNSFTLEYSTSKEKQMKDSKLGELEELILLTVAFLQEDAYNVRIREELKEQANRLPSMGALYTALTRLEKKEYLSSDMKGAEDIREGRRKRVYEVTAAGKEALREAHYLRNKLWHQIAQLNLDWNHG